jgi:hypothetical protein
MAPAFERSKHHEEVGGPVALVLVIETGRTSCFHRDRHACAGRSPHDLRDHMGGLGGTRGRIHETSCSVVISARRVSDERYLSVARVPSSHSASRARRDIFPSCSHELCCSRHSITRSGKGHETDGHSGARLRLSFCDLFYDGELLNGVGRPHWHYEPATNSELLDQRRRDMLDCSCHDHCVERTAVSVKVGDGYHGWPVDAAGARRCRGDSGWTTAARKDTSPDDAAIRRHVDGATEDFNPSLTTFAGLS